LQTLTKLLVHPCDELCKQSNIIDLYSRLVANYNLFIYLFVILKIISASHNDL